MAYLDVISLAEAKVYLRIDDTLNDDDNQITRMINAALSYVEKYTGHLVYDRNVKYRLIDGEVRVYDYPVNSEVTTELTSENKTLHTIYKKGSSNDEIELNVGYAVAANVPQELVEAAYEIIDIYYYGKENGKTMADLSPMSRQALDQNKRFLV